MRILHTSDWHVGKRLNGRERLDEQADVLNEIAELCESENVDLVLVAGDIFDTFTPSAEAEELFFSSIKKIAGENRSVLLISGNHDDGVRLSACAPLAQEYGIYVVGNAREPLPLSSTRGVRPVRSGKGYAVFENGAGEQTFVCTLPYPNEARFKEEKSPLSYVEQMQAWMNEGAAQNTDGLPSVLVAHIFVLGGAVSEGERSIDVGGARAVPVESLPKCDYIALGHLHKRQHFGKGHCYYSGSPLQYAFDEKADKGVKVFDLTAGGVENLRDVPLQSGKRLVRLEAASVADGIQRLQENAEHLVELTLHLTAPLSSMEASALSAIGNLVLLLTQVHAETEYTAVSRRQFTDAELFDEFYRSQYGEQADERLKQLFLEALAEADEGR